jgi:hypothetical protein
MNEYIFSTPEGQTLSPNGSDVENCQFLGRVSAPDSAQAKTRLIEENPWILQAGFDPNACNRDQILTDSQRHDILTLLDHFDECEKRGFETTNIADKSEHLFRVIQRLRQMCEA